MELNLTGDVIRALEADDHARLPEPVYTRGYIRAYARLLQLDSESIAATYNATLNTGESLHPVPGMDGAVGARSYKVKAISAVVAIVLVGLVLVHWMQERTLQDSLSVGPALPAPAGSAVPEASVPPTPAAPQEARSPQPASWQNLEHTVIAGEYSHPGPDAQSMRGMEPSEDAAMAPLPEGRLVLQFNEQCWTEIRDVDGRLLVGKLAAAGERLRISGEEPLSLLLGNAHGVILEYDGRRIDLAEFTRGNVARLVLAADKPPTRPR